MPTQSIILGAGWTRVRTVILEPWAEEFAVPVGSKLEIKIEYTHPGPIEIDDNEAYFVVWAWGGCRAKVTIDGSDVSPVSLQITTP